MVLRLKNEKFLVMEKLELESKKIPITVLVAAKNEEGRLGRCLDSLSSFAEVIVIDSYSTDGTVEVAKKYNAKVVNFKWNNAYPKKRQWFIDTQITGYNWILWIDADEVLTAGFVEEIKLLADDDHRFSLYSGFFVSSGYIWKGRVLRHGLKNNKLALYNKTMVAFPEVTDLDFDGMGEIEGHYQPVKKQGYENMRIGQINCPILHYAYEDDSSWKARHERYARWEAQMIVHDAYPKDPILWREWLKKLTRKSSLRPALMFVYSYVFKLGLLDGKAGLSFALTRKDYCDMVLRNLRKLKEGGGLL